MIASKSRGKTEAQKFVEFYQWIRRDIYNFAKACGIKNLTFQHKQLLDAVNAMKPGEKEMIAVRSGQGPGKTFCSALIGPWRLLRGTNAKLIVTAPTMAQCRDVWLAQAKKHIEGVDSHPYLRRIFRFTGTGIGVMKRHQKVWGAMMKTGSRSVNMRGQHEELMDILVEESSGCEDETMEVLEGTLTNKDALFLQIGNPTERTGYFYDSFYFDSRNKWKKIHWDAEKTPDSSWFNQQKNRDLAVKFGRESDFYRINVRGEFPKADPDGVIPEDRLRRCIKDNSQHRMMLVKCGGELITQIGMDFARFGGDESCAAYRRGNAIFRLQPYIKKEPISVVRDVFEMQKKLRWKDLDVIYVPDSVGVGQGVLGLFYEAKKKVNEFHPLAHAAKRRMFANAQSEAWWCLREKVLKGLFWMPDDPVAIKQLVTRKYETKGGLIKVESKEDYVKRGFDSPDRADSIVQAMWDDAKQFCRVS